MMNQPDPGVQRAEQKLTAAPILARIVAEMGGNIFRRQELMRELRAVTTRHVITYIALMSAPGSAIGVDDIAPFQSVLQTIPEGVPLDLVLNSPGGIPDVAEKFITMIRDRNHALRVVVPNFAKSAATLICLGADSIAMGDPSELGPTDPQMPRVIPGGGMSMLPAHAYLDAYEELANRINTDAPAIKAADIIQLQQMDPAFLQWCRQAVKASQQLGEQWLRRYMLKPLDSATTPLDSGIAGDAAVTEDLPARIARQLAESRDYLSHARMIGHRDAAAMGLKVEYLPSGGKLWEMFWELYCRIEVSMRPNQQVKVFESEAASIGLRTG
jgi:hypothetical protein